jgi:septal ring factor EnvC (AmiA/AmiB activator)
VVEEGGGACNAGIHGPAPVLDCFPDRSSSFLYLWPAMTDEEFERLKQAEKEHLREKKRLQRTLAALKRRNRAQGILQKMKHGAQRLLDETESLVDTLRSQIARDEAQLEVVVDEDDRDDLREAEEELREERAESLVEQYKTASGPASSESGSEVHDTPEKNSSSPDGPDKTIGRMPRSDEDPA